MCAEAIHLVRKDPLEFLVADPQSIRDAAVAFWWERRQWPNWPIERYYRVLDWRYESLSNGPPQVYIARNGESGRLLGHIAVYRRVFRLNESVLSIGVPSSLAIHPDYQGGLAGARLTSFPARQLRSGVYDVILGFANRIAQDLFLRLGAADLGRMSEYADVRRSAPIIHRRLPLAAPLAFVVDAGLSARRRWLRRHRGPVPKVDVVPLTADQFRGVDRSHWTFERDKVVAADSSDYIARRYLECPYAERQLYALFGKSSGNCEGFVITEGDERVDLWDVRVNSTQLDVATAIFSASKALNRAKTLSASTLPYCSVANELGAAGFVRTKSEQSSTYPRLVDAIVRPRHALEAQLKDFSRWYIWTGTSQY